MGWEAGNPTLRFRLDHSATPVGNSTWVLVGALSAKVKIAEIFDSSGKALEFKQDTTAGTGAGNINMYVMPGGNGRIPLDIGYGPTLNLYVRAIDGPTATGQLLINLFN